MGKRPIDTVNAYLSVIKKALSTSCAVLLLLLIFEGVTNVKWFFGNEKESHIIVLGGTMFHQHAFWKPDKTAGSK